MHEPRRRRHGSRRGNYSSARCAGSWSQPRIGCGHRARSMRQGQATSALSAPATARAFQSGRGLREPPPLLPVDSPPRRRPELLRRFLLPLSGRGTSRCRDRHCAACPSRSARLPNQVTKPGTVAAAQIDLATRPTTDARIAMKAASPRFGASAFSTWPSRHPRPSPRSGPTHRPHAATGLASGTASWPTAAIRWRR